MITRVSDEFFAFLHSQYLAITFGEVGLDPAYTNIAPSQVKLETRFSRRVPLNVPIVSAAMDTVTESKMAIALAKLGGLGVIHRGLEAEQQAREVGRVKYHLNGLIAKPICVNADDSIESILMMREVKGYTFHSFLVKDSSGRLAGVLTGSKFDFCNNHSLSAKEVMATDVITAPVGTTLDEAYDLMVRHEVKVLPVVNEDRHIQGLYIFSDVQRIKTGQLANCNVDARGQLRVGAAVGVGPEAIERVKLLGEQSVDVAVIDTAHAHTEDAAQTVRDLKRAFPDIDIVVGNISRPEAARLLIEAGADGVKVGQGSGSICTTQIVTGVGYPQVSAVADCARIAEEADVPVCSDGGVRHSGDITTALAAGASCVMLGNLLAGTAESPGDIVFHQGRQWKDYRGMGSLGAMRISKGARQRYQQTGSGKSQLVPEGVEGMVAYKGGIGQIMVQYLEGLRRGMAETGSSTIAELWSKARFHRVGSGGRREMHPHDVLITKEAPNYSGGHSDER